MHKCKANQRRLEGNRKGISYDTPGLGGYTRTRRIRETLSANDGPRREKRKKLQ
jgi:hypothetical protein